VESWKAIALGGMIAGLLATGYIFITPPKYQATANIQVARVAGSDIESPAILLEKMKIPSYYSQKTYLACNVKDAVDPGMTIASNLKPILVKSAPIIKVSYKAASRKEAVSCLEAVMDEIRFNQNILSKSVINTKLTQLLALKQKLHTIESFRSKLTNLNLDFSDSKSSSSNLLLAITIMKENEIKDLRFQISDIEISLVEPQTIETFLSAPIYSSDQKVSPKRAMSMIGGGVAGLFFGLLLMLGHRVYRAYKVSKS
jgi:uncharacterized protein involved in exopolysaccharide biosynthesis